MKIAVFGDGDTALKVASISRSKGNETEIVTVSDKLSTEIKTITADKMRGKYDAIILTNPADNKKLAWQIGPFLKEDGFVLTLQPGSPERQLTAELGEEKVVAGIYDEGKIIIEKGFHASQAADILDAEISDSISQRRFDKIAEAAFGAISSIAGCSMEIITSNENWLNLMINCAKEFMSICAEEHVYDIKINGYLPADLMTMKGFVKKKYPVKKIIDAIPDYSHKTPVLEFEAICEYALKNDIDAPISKITLELLKKIQCNEIKRGPQNIKMYA